MRSVTFRLPWPPSINHYYGRTRTGRVYLGEAGRQFRKDAAHILEQMGGPRLEGPVEVSLIYLPPDKRIRDIDNPRKAVYDAISDRYDKNGTRVHVGVLPDDVNIRSDRAVFVEAGMGMVEVIITELKGGCNDYFGRTRRKAGGSKGKAQEKPTGGKRRGQLRNDGAGDDSAQSY